jgi:4-amino-4-deoxy-L-arabinose transferase-like glycosyltransferase
MHRIEARLAALPPRTGLALVALLALLAFLPGFAALPPVDRDEARFAQSSRQMLASGDLIDIRFEDGTRYKKPVGIYWLQAAAVAASGPTEAAPIWRYRLPSLVAAVLAAVLTARLGQLFGGPRAGLAAGLCVAGLTVLGGEARLAKTDAVLLVTVLAAQLVLARHWLACGRGRVPGPRIGTADLLQFWGATGAGLLVKGPVGLLFVALTALALAALAGRARWLLGLRPAAGTALAAALVVPWYAAITLEAGGAFWAEALGRDLLGKVAEGQESHGAPPGTHLAALWFAAFPATPALALALPAIWRGRAAAGLTFALAWALPGWLLFEAVATKLLHYTLPALPALALAVALVWDDVVAAPRPMWARALAVLAGLVPFAVLAAAGAWLAGTGDLPAVPLAAGAAGVAAGLAGFALALRRGRALAALLALWLAGAAFQGGLMRAAASAPQLWPAAALAALAQPAGGCPQVTIMAAGYGEPSLVFLAAGPVRRVPAAAALAAARADACVRAAVPSTTPPPADLRALGTVEGVNLGTGRPVRLTVYAR